MDSKENCINIGPLIHRITELVNHFEASSLRIKRLESVDFTTLVNKSAALFPEIIETCGVGKVGVDDIALLIDTSLNLCRIGISIVPKELSVVFTCSVHNLLCVVLTGMYSSVTHVITTIYQRLSRIISIIDPSDPNSFGIWQCFIKVVSKCGNITDEERLLHVSLLIHHSAIISEIPHTHDLQRWSQFLKVLLRLNKHCLRKNQLNNPKIVTDIVKLTKALNEPDMVDGLLKLRIKEIDNSTLEDLSKLSFSLESFGFNDDNPGNDTVGHYLLRGDRFQDQANFNCLDFFNSSQLNLKKTLAAVLPPKDFQVALKEYWVRLSLVSPQTTMRSERISYNLVGNLCNLIIAGTFDMKFPLPIFKSCLRKVSFHLPSNQFSRFSISQKLVLTATLAPMTASCTMRNDIKKFMQQIPMILKNTVDRTLVYWPLAILVEMVKMDPQPTISKDLCNISLNLLSPHQECEPIHPRLLSLIVTGLLACLGYVELNFIEKIVEITKVLPPFFRLKILTQLSFVTNYTCSAELLQSILQSNFTKGTLDYLTISSLPLCEGMLRFINSIDISSLFDSPGLSHIQPLLISFIGRKRPDCDQSKLCLEKLKRTISNPQQSYQIPLSPPPLPLESSVNDTIDNLLSNLERYLRSLEGSPNYNETIKILESVINQQK